MRQHTSSRYRSETYSIVVRSFKPVSAHPVWLGLYALEDHRVVLDEALAERLLVTFVEVVKLALGLSDRLLDPVFLILYVLNRLHHIVNFATAHLLLVVVLQLLFNFLALAFSVLELKDLLFNGLEGLDVLKKDHMG